MYLWTLMTSRYATILSLLLLYSLCKQYLYPMLLLPAMLLPAADVTAVASETYSDSAAMSNLGNSDTACSYTYGTSSSARLYAAL
jgi:hypothetical protein